jgi:integrase
LADTETKQSHVVDLDPRTCEILAAYKATVRGPVGEGYVFSDDGGATAWKPNRVTKTFGRYRRALGLRSFRLHDLRHFVATQMFEAGVPIATVSRRLAHRWVSTTLDHYAHSVPAEPLTPPRSSDPSSKTPPTRALPHQHTIGQHDSAPPLIPAQIGSRESRG